MRKLTGKYLFSVILFFFILQGCTEIRDGSEANGVNQEVPDQEILDAEVIFTKSERITSILKARRLLIFEAKRLTIADSAFTLDIFDSEGKHTSVITADSGVVKGEDSLVAIGNVVVVSDSGVILETEILFWDRLRGGVRSDTDVVLTTESDTLYGDGLIADEALNNWEIFNPRGTTIREIKKKP